MLKGLEVNILVLDNSQFFGGFRGQYFSPKQFTILEGFRDQYFSHKYTILEGFRGQYFSPRQFTILGGFRGQYFSHKQYTIIEWFRV